MVGILHTRVHSEIVASLVVEATELYTLRQENLTFEGCWAFMVQPAGQAIGKVLTMVERDATGANRSANDVSAEHRVKRALLTSYIIFIHFFCDSFLLGNVAEVTKPPTYT